MNYVSFKWNIYYDFLLLLTEILKEKDDYRYLGGISFLKLKYGEGLGFKKNPADNYSEYQAQNQRPLYLPS